ncbi:protein-disulfide reductase DsbD [Marinospirillum alkaliphilum]|uniref:Thiol:disulfide interchange protein DsbD n=1 Tax=Marinospirillum alkaliphilum DSM 21637 TaxID=1122209 RepID=A0A1K1YXS5_9GAMM|nr:protein-disulfide reductase DsbD [Marinospirillum alkaliphilum]SFX66737.1 thiol:disulfide interchange protein DsbD [Marinospirillum alkaliphilum DSM 21637]
MLQIPARLRHSLLLLLLFFTFASAQASSLFDSGNSNRFSSWLSNSSNSQPRFLPPEQAFQAQARVDGSQVFVRWQIEPGYYLYREQLNIQLPENTGLTLVRIDFPPSVSHEDDYFGKTEVYYQQVELAGLLSGETSLAELELTLAYQGCAEAGLCYPPQRITRTVSLQQLDTSAAPRLPEAPRQIAPPPSSGSRLTQILNSGETWLILGLFFVAGLGLTFTPCVLPMLPILSAIIIGKGGQNVTPSKTRGLLLSSAYVSGMALTYALLGAVMGLFGAGLNLQAALQSPWLLVPFALLFVLLALALFGAWELRLPRWLDDRLQQLQQPRGGTLMNVAGMGALSTLVVSPCLTAPLAGALAFIASTGNAATGAMALFAMGLGMGVPLILTGTFGAHWLPRAGAWMNQVKALFGLLMLVVAVWLVERLLPASLSMALWGLLALGSGVFIGGLNFRAAGGWQKLRLSAGLALLLYGASLLLGALAGNSNPLQPLAGIGSKNQPQLQPLADVPRIQQLDELKSLLASSEQPVLVDLYADWCISCKVMESRVFPRSDIQQELRGINRYKLDLTRISPEVRSWLDEHQLFGPPTLMFFVQGQEWTDWRLQGEVGARELLRHLQAFNQAQH